MFYCQNGLLLKPASWACCCKHLSAANRPDLPEWSLQLMQILFSLICFYCSINYVLPWRTSSCTKFRHGNRFYMNFKWLFMSIWFVTNLCGNHKLISFKTCNFSLFFVNRTCQFGVIKSFKNYSWNLISK